MTRIVVPCARGTEDHARAELEAIGVTSPVAGRGEVSGEADYAIALRVCLWSRVGSRVLWPLFDCDAPDPEALYAGLVAFAFEDHLAIGRSFAIDVTLGLGVGERLRHTQFVAQKSKDAVVDRLRERRGARPDVDRDRPDLRLHLHLADGHAALSVDLAGESLHRRGYRSDGRLAPLKETLAAALLYAMEWPRRAEAGEPLCDPMCGSGTIVLEAALMLGDRAPGLLRQRWGFSGWSGHDAAAWEPLAAEARERARAGLRKLDATPRLFGFDEDAESIAAAERNAGIAGLAGRARFAVARIDTLGAPPGPGLVLTNPPYGERLGDDASLPPLYRALGDVLKRRFVGWRAGVLTAHGPLPKAIGLRAARREIFWNGPIECRLLDLPISDRPTTGDGPAWRKPNEASLAFSNRVVKNWKHLGKWARREGVHALRVYDADLPEYAVAVDLYEGTPEHGGTVERWAYVQEYAPPKEIEPQKAEKRLSDVIARLPEALTLEADRVVLRKRRRQRPGDQYEAEEPGRGLVVEEGGHRFLVRLGDYVDTGLFLDQRTLREKIGAASSGKNVLNLFSYTGSVTVYAAKAGARASTSVDLSKTYLAWAEDNFALNDVDGMRHRLVHDDCVRWLDVASAGRERWDVIVLAPPTFSNSKRMEGVLDTQRDHGSLLEACARLLSPGGAIYFVTHFRRFKLEAPSSLAAEVLSVIPPDFARDARFHSAWKLTPR